MNPLGIKSLISSLHFFIFCIDGLFSSMFLAVLALAWASFSLPLLHSASICIFSCCAWFWIERIVDWSMPFMQAWNCCMFRFISAMLSSLIPSGFGADSALVEIKRNRRNNFFMVSITSIGGCHYFIVFFWEYQMAMGISLDVASGCLNSLFEFAESAGLLFNIFFKVSRLFSKFLDRLFIKSFRRYFADVRVGSN